MSRKAFKADEKEWAIQKTQGKPLSEVLWVDWALAHDCDQRLINTILRSFAQKSLYRESITTQMVLDLVKTGEIVKLPYVGTTALVWLMGAFMEELQNA